MINPHLLVSVFICPEGLGQQKYDLGASKDIGDPFFRIGRYFTAMNSLRSIEWESVTIYVDTDPCWTYIKQDIIDKTLLMHPSANIFPFRLSSTSQWKNASEAYDSDSIIYLHSNDDHAFVSDVNVDFYELVNVMNANSEIKLGAVTHHPEMMGILFRNRTRKQRGMNIVEIGYAIGTTLVRGDFFRSWWDRDNFESQERIVRPDNPFGKSVTFNQVQMVVPLREQMRHLDGYSHLGLFLPLTPLRNTLTYESMGNQFLLREKSWTYGYWPSKLYSIHGKGPDFHITATHTSVSLVKHVQIGVARIQASFALRISFTRLISIVRNTHDPIHGMAVAPAIALALLSPCVMRNLFNYFFDLPALVTLRLVSLISGKPNLVSGNVWYKGLSRTWQLRLNKN